MGAAGWGWNDVLPFYKKLENDFDFGGDEHGKDGPVPIRRTPQEDWAPLSKAVFAYAQERQMSYLADMNTDFRDGYGSVPMSNWPDKRGLGGDLLSRCGDARAQQPHHHQRRDRDRLRVRRPPRHRRQGADRRRGQDFSRARGDLLARRHPFAGIPDAPGHRSGASICATTASRCAPTCRASARTCRTTPSCSSVCCRSRGARQAESHPAAPDDVLPLFVRPAGRAAQRHVHQRAVQDLVEPARLPGRQSGADPAQADGARPRVAEGSERAAEPQVEFNFCGHELDTAALHAGLPPLRSRFWRTRRCAP